MAASATVVDSFLIPYSNNLWQVIADVTFTSTYSTGGETLAISSFLPGGKEILAITTSGGSATNLSYVNDTGKLKVWQCETASQEQVEAANGTDLTGAATRCVLIIRK